MVLGNKKISAENFASKFYKIGYHLEAPLDRAARNTMRLISHIRPGHYDQADFSLVEKAVRIKKLFETLLLFPLILTLLPLQSTLRFLANTITPKPFTYLKGNISDPTEIAEEIPTAGENNSTDAGKVSVLQLNCCFAGFAAYFAGGVGYQKDRKDQIIDKLSKVNNDIIVLQEIYGGESFEIYNALKEKYGHFYINIGAKPNVGTSFWRRINPFYKNSGLMVISKYPLKDVSFDSFSDIENPQQSCTEAFSLPFCK